MSVGKLINFFSSFTKLPIYAEDVRDHIVDLGIQDIIEFRPMDADPSKLLGLFFRYRVSSAPYSPTDNHSIIFYNGNVSPDEQNFICCKELMHVFDDSLKAAVTTEAQLDGLLSYLFKEAPNPSQMSISGILDRAAEYAALAVMFPEDVRDKFVEALSNRTMTEKEIALELGVPEKHVGELLSERWGKMLGMLRAL